MLVLLIDLGWIKIPIQFFFRQILLLFVYLGVFFFHMTNQGFHLFFVDIGAVRKPHAIKGHVGGGGVVRQIIESGGCNWSRGS